MAHVMNLEDCTERLVSMALKVVPLLHDHQAAMALVAEDMVALRQQVRETVAPLAQPTRVRCKECYFRMSPYPLRWREYCLLGLVRRECGSVAFTSESTLWMGVESRLRESLAKT